MVIYVTDTPVEYLDISSWHLVVTLIVLSQRVNRVVYVQMSRRFHKSGRPVASGEPELLQVERRNAEENAVQQLELLQKNVATPANRRVKVRRPPDVQHFRFGVHCEKVFG